MTTRTKRTLHRTSVIAALASMVITTSIALIDAPPATAGPSARARGEAARLVAQRRPAKKRRARKKAAPTRLTGVVNINTATEAQLQKLPGIGPAKAERIVRLRERRGKFRRIRDLRRVKGIGRKTVKRLRKHLTIRGPTTLR